MGGGFVAWVDPLTDAMRGAAFADRINEPDHIAGIRFVNTKEASADVGLAGQGLQDSHTSPHGRQGAE